MGDKENEATANKGPRELSPNIAFLALIVLALGYNFVVAYLNSDHSSNTDRASAVAGEFDDASSDAAGEGTEQTSTNQDSSLPGTIDAGGMVTQPNGDKGWYYPPNKIFYKQVPAPSELADFTCVEVPDLSLQPIPKNFDMSLITAPRVATIYGAIAVNGPDHGSIYDVQEEAYAFIGGVKYKLRIDTDSDSWLDPWDVHAKDVACSKVELQQ